MPPEGVPVLPSALVANPHNGPKPNVVPPIADSAEPQEK
jgi:hypothetical protein